jgi:antibiotic biosynthesis monooxygenase (ABM) superfamily enzyme
MTRGRANRLIFCVLVFAAVYPLVTGLSYLVQQATPDWQLWQRHLIIVPMIVTAMVFAIMPCIHRLLRPNTSPETSACRR